MSATTYRVLETGVTSSPSPRAIDLGFGSVCFASADEEEVMDAHGEPVSIDAGVLVCDLAQYHDGPHWDEKDETTWGLDL